MFNFRKYIWVNYLLYDLLTPISISHFWRFGFVLGVFFALQFLSGVFLSFHFFIPSFDRVIYISNEIWMGELFRLIHRVGVTFIFICLYLHILRGLVIKRYLLLPVWGRGVVIFLFFVLTAFLGYSLPWTQIRFWAVTVITNLATVVPVVGKKLILLLWGGFGVDHPTLVRFYSFHFLFPFIILVIIVFHIFSLHLVHSQGKTSLKSEGLKFSPFFFLKRSSGFIYFCYFVGFLLSMNERESSRKRHICREFSTSSTWTYCPRVIFSSILCSPTKSPQ